MSYDEIIKKAIGEDFEEIRYHDDCYVSVKECKKIMKKFSLLLAQALEESLQPSLVECPGCNEEIDESHLYCPNCGDENF